jgi:hypothetical protein
MLLGVSRPSVSVTIEEFVRLGMLRVERARILIGNRDGLLRVSCDCYDVIKKELRSGRSMIYSQHVFPLDDAATYEPRRITQGL